MLTGMHFVKKLLYVSYSAVQYGSFPVSYVSWMFVYVMIWVSHDKASAALRDNHSNKYYCYCDS